MKRVRIAHAESCDWKKDIRGFLFAYRSTPHSATGVSPAELMFGRKLRNKLPQIELDHEKTVDEGVRDTDWCAKVKNKLYIDDKRGARESDLIEGDQVLVKQTRKDKPSAPFNPTPFKLQRKIGNQCTVVSPEGVEYKRNSTHVKKYLNPETVDKPVMNSDNVSPEIHANNPMTSGIEPGATSTDDVMSSKSSEGEDHETVPDIPRSRPSRARTLPKHFDDYHMDS